ncbi:hypothetical protein C9374_008925 [Naegleria lovaniensis]|uniref:Uncharacterized protein n=1 Tax=Naegleria lovaniensis TaxID=51637 RepID=A0AA88GJB0_NAELO|nr:uncharacterized protein C9374_008925 [Naegleria lovaniensis]KAG2377840.1 hypothetical protein C9374_008925 [Naegleria lovaniensis]
MRNNFSPEEALTMKIFHSGIVAFEDSKDSKVFQITLGGALSFIDCMDPNSTQLMEITKMQMKHFLTDGKLPLGDSQFIQNQELEKKQLEKLKEMKMGGCVLKCVLESQNYVLAVGLKYNANTIFNRVGKEDSASLLIKLEHDFYY